MSETPAEIEPDDTEQLGDEPEPTEDGEPCAVVPTEGE